MTGTTSGQTTNNLTGQTTANVTEAPNMNHYQWRQRIREDAVVTWPESWIFEEYDEDCECYNFYYYDLDGLEGNIVLKKKDILRFYLFMKYNEAEQKLNRHKRDS